MSLAILDPAMHKVTGDPKHIDPVPGGEKKDRAAEAAKAKPAAPPKRKSLKPFAIKEFKYQIAKSR